MALVPCRQRLVHLAERRDAPLTLVVWRLLQTARRGLATARGDTASLIAQMLHPYAIMG
jgi:hypothetical protein